MPSKLASRNSWLVRYAAAVAAVGAGFLVRLALTAWFGPGLPTYITFYPAVMAVALLAGFGPGLVATATTALATDYWLLPPVGFGIEKPVDAVGLVFFLGMGLFMCWVAEFYRRARQKAAAYDQELALRESQEEVRRQREWLKVTLSSIGDAVLATNMAGRITFFNPVAETLTGYPEHEALGQPLHNVFRTVNEETCFPGEDILARVLSEGRIITLANHTALVARDGRQIPIEDSAAPIKDSAGVVSGVVVVFHDVTEKRRAQAAMRESQRQNEFLANIIERASQPFAVGYPDGRMGLVNRAYEELTGYTAEELRAIDWATTLTPPEWREAERLKLEELQRTGQPVRYEKEYVRKDGRRVPVELLVHLARDVEGKPEYYYSFLTNITVRKQAEEAVRQLNAELQERVVQMQAANEALRTSREAALNLMDDALQARKEAEEASARLRASSEQRRLALEAADLGAWDYHFQAGNVTWDERCREMWGIPESDRVDYAAAINRIHPDDREGVDAAVQQALAGADGGAYHREFRVVWPDGSVHWIASHGHVYFQGEDDQRRPIRFIGANREITADREAQEALRESEERLAAFAATTFEGIILSEGGRIVDCNDQFAQMLGSTTQEVIGTTVEQHTAPEDRQRVLENIRAGRESVTEHQLLRRDGSRITVEAHGHPSHASRGDLRHTAIRDVTERKRREEQLKNLNRTLTALKDSSLAMLRATSEADYLNEVCKIIVEDCSHAMVWVGLAEEDRARTVRPVAHAGFEEGYLESLNATWDDTERGRGPTGTAIRTGIPCACKNLLTDPRFAPWRPEALKRGYASSLAVPLRADAKPFGAITIYSKHPDPFSADEVKLLAQLADDVSYCVVALRLRAAKAQADLERERAQAALQQTAEDLKRSNRDLEQFAYVASHDLQEPLRAVGGYVKLIERRLSGTLDAKVREFIAGAFEGAVRMERLIHDLLVFSRVGTRGGDFVPTDLDAVLQQALRNLEAGIASAQTTLTHDSLPTLTVDATQLMQVFQNLIGNALKFRGELPPRIHVGAQQEDGRWVFSVQDNGIGIEPEYFEKIFQIFQRLHTRKQYPGTGIGLAICKRIIERHGGTIWVKSQPGQGSTFYFSIPT